MRYHCGSWKKPAHAVSGCETLDCVPPVSSACRSLFPIWPFPPRPVDSSRLTLTYCSKPVAAALLVNCAALIHVTASISSTVDLSTCFREAASLLESAVSSSVGLTLCPVGEGEQPRRCGLESVMWSLHEPLPLNASAIVMVAYCSCCAAVCVCGYHAMAWVGRGVQCVQQGRAVSNRNNFVSFTPGARALTL